MGHLLGGFRLWRRRPGLMALGVVPALIVLVVLLALLALLLTQLDELTDLLTPFADDWSDGPRTLVRVGLGVLVLLGALLLASATFTGLTLAVGDPFYERIWREVELELGGPVPDHGPGFWASARDGAALAGLGLAVSAGMLVVGLLPVVGTIVGLVLGTMLTGRLLALELLSRPLAARGLDRDARRALVRGHGSQVLGFGVATQLCFLVPLGAVVTMPAAVAGATTLARDLLGSSAQEPLTAA